MLFKIKLQYLDSDSNILQSDEFLNFVLLVKIEIKHPVVKCWKRFWSIQLTTFFFLIDLWYVDVTNIIYQSFTEKHM